MTIREQLEKEMDKQEIEEMEEKMLTTKSAIKWIILIITTALMQIETIRVKGHWIFGGNTVFPF
ncbi:hypothetical protein JCM16775_p2009 (plasmid) [Leptotrichia hofstadii]|uniref:Uncharacterized protein n=1 Tax=Leptotrichia hofstadii TaxID=157688 RepID=A0A510JKH1_9FUSO|nr:hypothetical protein [Leptotrichia hofstadii]BBM39784.1 hypothetical protein JCM16775_p2009 [Leptotrichia hofstadii]